MVVASPSTVGLVENDLFDASLIHPCQQTFDLEIVGAHTVKRRQRSEQDVVDTAKATRLLDHVNVLGLLDDANQSMVTRSVGAERTRIDVRDVVANRAVGDAILDVADGVAQPLGILTWGL